MEPRRRPAPRRGRVPGDRRGRRRRSSISPAISACGWRRRAPATTPAPLGLARRTRSCSKTERMREVDDRPGSAGSPASRPASSGWRSSRPPPRTAWRRWRAPRPTSASSATRSAAALSWLGRKHGLAANNVDGDRARHRRRRSCVRADRDTEPDLFWALRGGGGNFGVVTALELELFPMTAGVCGHALVPDRARPRGAARVARAGPRRAAGRADDRRPAPAAPADPGDPRAASAASRS